MWPIEEQSEPASRWEEETLFTEGDRFFNEILQSIARAQKSIKIETYIFELDSLGKKILQALGDAADRGVSVKLMIDGAGCSEWTAEDAFQYRKRRFEIRFFHPLVWQRRHSRLWTYLNLAKVIRGLSLMNHRNHRKVFLFDDQIAYVGSMNVTSKNLNQVQGEKAWRDCSVRIQGPGVGVLHESFDEAWTYYQNYSLRYFRINQPTYEFPLLNMNRTIRQRRHYYHRILKRLYTSKNEILITNPYFIPTWRLRRILKSAVSNNVRVVTLFPHESDFIGVKFAMESFYTGLLRSGIEIHEYLPSMLHSKILITDHRAILGSSNLNSRSLKLDLEVDVEITNPENIALLKELFNQDLLKSKKISLHEWRSRPISRKALENLFIVFRWML
jgi:cardiolipin synthase